MKKVKIKSHIRNGKLFSNRGLFVKSLESFEGKNILITVEKEKEKRSNAANRYYWGVVVKMIKMAIDEQTGDVVTIDDVHDLLKARFNPLDIQRADKKSVSRIGKSTADLSVPAFASYVEKCVLWGNDFFNIQIPEPGEDLTQE